MKQTNSGLLLVPAGFLHHQWGAIPLLVDDVRPAGGSGLPQVSDRTGTQQDTAAEVSKICFRLLGRFWPKLGSRHETGANGSGRCLVPAAVDSEYRATKAGGSPQKRFIALHLSVCSPV